jgi:hypothetical protein
MIPNIRGNGTTQAFGNHLQSCGSEAGQDWSNVQDQQIPSALQVQQSTPKPVAWGVRQVQDSSGMSGTLGVVIGMAAGWALLMIRRGP